MRDLPAFRKEAIRYWEFRRIFYNLALLLPSLFTYFATATLAAVGDYEDLPYAYTLPIFLIWAIGANACYSLGYALEFMFASDFYDSRWLRYGRSTTFALGTFVSIIFALIASRDIAYMEYTHKVEISRKRSAEGGN